MILIQIIYVQKFFNNNIVKSAFLSISTFDGIYDIKLSSLSLWIFKRHFTYMYLYGIVFRFQPFCRTEYYLSLTNIVTSLAQCYQMW